MRRSLLGVVVVIFAACGGSSRTEGGGGSAEAGAAGRGADNVGRTTGEAGEERSVGGAEPTDGKPSTVCVPNETQLCYGPGACRGAQPCRADGSGWEPCDCGDAAADNGGRAAEASDPTDSAGRSAEEPTNLGGSAGTSATGGVPAGGSGEEHSGGTPMGGSAGGDVTSSGETPVGRGGTGNTGGGASGATHTGGMTNTGGMANTGGATVTGGTTSVGGSGDGPFTVKAGGYVTSGRIKGLAWTAGDDVTPHDFSHLAAGGELCVSGTAPATSDYSGIGMIGINLNQPPTGSTEGENFTPTGSGIKIRVTNPGGSKLQLQVQGSSGYYCTDITAPGGSFDWGELKTECWDTGGTAYAPSRAITAIMVLVRGEGPDGSDTDYEFCITDLEEVP